MIPKDIIERLAYVIWERRRTWGFSENNDVNNYLQAESMINRYLSGEEMGLGAYLSDEDCVVLEAIRVCQT